MKNAHTPWTPIEDFLLMNFYGNRPHYWLHYFLGRTDEAVRRRIGNLFKKDLRQLGYFYLPPIPLEPLRVFLYQINFDQY